MDKGNEDKDCHGQIFILSLVTIDAKDHANTYCTASKIFDGDVTHLQIHLRANGEMHPCQGNNVCKEVVQVCVQRITTKEVGSVPMWRPCPFKTNKPQELRDEIKTILSQSAPLLSGKKKRIVICAIGKDGKSSTINNILTALEGKYSETANIGGGGNGGQVTKKYIEYHMLFDGLGEAKNTCFVLCDTPGLSDQNEEVQTEAIKAVLDGKFLSGDTLAFDDLTLESLGQMKAKEPMAACVIFVFAARNVNFTSDKKNGTMVISVALKSLRSILEYARRHNIKTACLMTKCDDLDYDVKKDIRNIYYSASIETARHVIEEYFEGFPINRIFPIVNYTDMLQPNPNMMVQTLFALKHILHDIQSNLRRTVRPEDIVN